MKKLFTKILGTHVVSDQAEGTISLVTDIHLDPETGKIIALQCGFKQVLTPIDILRWGNVIHINDHTALTTREHVLRLQNVSRAREQLMYKLVYTESGELIGRIHNYTIDTKAMILWNLVVKKKFLWFVTFETTIPRKNIVEILEDRVIVKDIHAMDKVKAVQAEVA